MDSKAIAFLLLLSAAAVAQTTATGRQDRNSSSPSVWLAAKPGVPAGKVEAVTMPSRAGQRDRRVWVYTPAGFDRSRKQPYDLLLVFDGEEYLEEIPLPVILNNLIAAGRVSPVVAVLIDSGSGAARLNDLANRAAFAAFVSDELVPWARQRWNGTRDPQRTILTGSSAGGLAAAYVAWQRPDLFGNVLAQSGAFWRGNEASNAAPFEWLTDQYRQAPKKPVTFWMEVGARETMAVLGGAGPVFIEANRRFRDVLRANGYTVEYKEVEGALHEPSHWRAVLPEGLLWLTARWVK